MTLIVNMDGTISRRLASHERSRARDLNDLIAEWHEVCRQVDELEARRRELELLIDRFSE